MTRRFRQFEDTGTVALTTSSQPQAETIVPNHGNIKAIMIEVINDTTGTLTGANNLSNCLETVQILDVNGRNVFTDIRGQDLHVLQQYGTGGNTISETTTSSSSATDVFYIPFDIPTKIMPLKINLTLGVIADMATSGATAANARIRVSAFYDDSSGSVVESERIVAKQITIGSTGVNNIAPFLLKGRKVMETYFEYTEANFTDTTFSADGDLELEQLSGDKLTGLENGVLIQGHQTGIFTLPHTPYIATENTRFDFNVSSTGTLRLYLRMEDRPPNQ